ncbi:MAG: hypothetical protein JXA30_11550 [Deltaproteobacteria bacterium]|nr:hypothetical protein [Deltaproteobacteria bacterium]
MQNARDSDGNVSLVDSGDRFVDDGDALDAFNSFDFFDTSDAMDAGDSLYNGVEEFTLEGTWEGELMFYGSDGALNGVTPATIEFTDTWIDVSVVGILIKFGYSLNTDQTPQHINIELFDPERTLPYPYIIPAFYKIEDGFLTLGLSFFSSQLKELNVEEKYFPMIFEVVRVP